MFSEPSEYNATTDTLNLSLSRYFAKAIILLLATDSIGGK